MKMKPFSTTVFFLTCVVVSRSDESCTCPSITTYSSADISDEIKSSNHPDDYCDDLNCRWVIKQGLPGTGIRLHIESFVTEATADYMDIFYVNQVTEQRLTRLTGNLEAAGLPRYTIGSDGGLELMFKTDGSVTRKGFLATFTRFNITAEECACPNFLHTVTDEEMTITSPNFPSNYCQNLQCYYFLKTTVPHSVEITFQEFQLENRYDSVSVFDGNSTESSQLIEKLTGQMSESKVITSRKDSMMIVFRSDADTGHRGFRATVKRVEGPCICKNTIHSGSSGSFSSPGFPDTYCTNVNCTYGVSVPGSRLLQVEFAKLELSSSDSLVVPSRLGGYNLPLIKWKGSSSESNRFTFDDHQGNFRLETGSSSMLKGGFNATYRAVTRDAGCTCPSPNPHNISSMSGTLSHNGCGPMDCFWVLNQPNSNANIISLWADNVHIHSTTDWLKIMKGRFQEIGSSPDVTRTFSGLSANGSEISIANTGGPVMIHFHTADAVTSSANTPVGFTLRYQWHVQNCNCGPQDLIANETVQNLTSPGFPVPYCNNLSCKYKITTTDGYQILMKFVEMRTETGDTDNIGVYDGEATARSNRLALMKGRLEDNDIHEFRSNGTTMHVWFTSDGSVVYKGYNLTYQRVPVLHQPSVISSIPPPVTPPEPGASVQEPQHVHPSAVPCKVDSEKVSASLSNQMAEYAVHSHNSGWPFATGFLLGLLLALIVVATVGLVLKFGRCRRGGSTATVSYKRHPSGTYIENQSYVASENGTSPI